MFPVVKRQKLLSLQSHVAPEYLQNTALICSPKEKHSPQCHISSSLFLYSSISGLYLYMHMKLTLIFHLQAEAKAEEAEKRASLAEKMVQLQKNIQKPVSVVTKCCSRKNPNPLPQSVIRGVCLPYHPTCTFTIPLNFKFQFIVSLLLECGFETALSFGISIDSLCGWFRYFLEPHNAMFCHG